MRECGPTSRFDWPYELRRESIIRPTGRLSSEWIRAEGLLMHARVSVDPTPSSSLPLVLVHGIGVASRFMVPVAELLAPYHRIYAPDLPGFGKSEKPNRILSLVELTDALAWWTRGIRYHHITGADYSHLLFRWSAPPFTGRGSSGTPPRPAY
jgi:pimeloyl-ACP methyl ester carboxylesterase